MSVHKTVKNIAIIVGVILLIFAVASVASAQITGGPIGSPSFWQKIGNILSPIDDTNTQVQINDLVAGTLTVTTVAQGYLETGYIIATSTTATSTFAGGLTVDSTDFVVDPDAGRVGIGTASPGYKLTVSSGDVAIDSTQKVYLDGGGDTYITESSANALNLFAGGFSMLSLSTSLISASQSTPWYIAGNVGIGTTSPTAKLSVTGSGTGTGRAFAVADSSNDEKFTILDNGTVVGGIGGLTGGYSLSPTGGSSFYGLAVYRSSSGLTAPDIWDAGGNGVVIGHNSSSADLVVDSNGQVGVGISSPEELLHVQGSSASGDIGLSNSSTALVAGDVAGSINFISQDSSTNLDGVFTKIDSVVEQDFNAYLRGMALRFFTRYETNVPDTPQERMRITSAGRIGIGETAPDSKLEIALATGEKVHLDGAGDVFLDVDRGSSAGAGRVRFQTAGTDEFEVGLKGSVAGFHITDGSVNELVTVLSSGNVGIGTTTPTEKLVVEGNLQFGQSTPSIWWNNEKTYGMYYNSSTKQIFVNNGNPVAELQLVSTADALWSVAQFSTGTTADSYPAHTFREDSDTGIALFGTGELSYATGGVTRILADSSGNIGIGGSITANTFAGSSMVVSSGNVGIGTTSPWRTLSVTGTVSFDGLTSSGTGNAVCITTNNDITDAGGISCTPSSIRFKENVTEYNTGLKTVLSLNPVSFDYKTGYYNLEDGKESIGLIAEDVEKVDTRLVDYEANGEVRTLYFERFVGVFTDAIQTLHTALTKVVVVLKQHESRIDELERENAELNARLEVLEARI